MKDIHIDKQSGKNFDKEQYELLKRVVRKEAIMVSIMVYVLEEFLLELEIRNYSKRTLT
ncbi:hypothetical protein OQL72_000297 [Clostridium perfringens]